MAKAAARGRRAKQDSGARERSFRLASEAAGLALLGMALLSALALASYSPSDPVFEFTGVTNRAGVVGATLAGWLYGAVGTGAIVVVAGVTWIGGRLVLGRGLPSATSRFWVGSALLLVSLSSMAPLLVELAPTQMASLRPGALGTALVSYQVLLLSTWGALLLNVMLFSIGALAVTGISTGRALEALGSGASRVGLLALFLVRRVGRGLSLAADTLARQLRGVADVFRRAAASVVVWREQRARRARAAASREPELPQAEEPAHEAVVERADTPPPEAPARRASRSHEPDIVDHKDDQKPPEPSQEAFHFRSRARGADKPFVLPDSSIFQRPPETGRSFDRDSLLMNARILEKKLQDFGVNGRVVRVHPGPVITMYEYEPAAGVKVNKIVNLSDDLSMALRAISIRIIAPLPGKSVVGIEVPNPNRDLVCLRSLLDSEDFRNSKSRLMLAMGKDIFGNCVCSDLAKMPHLLVAGATGTGKSVFLNSMLCSILSRATPDELKLLLIDPKLLELSIYEGIPHLIADVVTNPKRAAAALQGVVRMMDERYQMMSAVHVRNIDQFNARVDEALEAGEASFRLKPPPGEEQGIEVEYRRLPYIVVVIDELADLMVQVARDVEESLQRLAQMARAAGIHLILATQRPSVDVLTGVIKANFPARVSFQVSSRIDSRTILDQGGADSLLGQGDMLFLPPGTSKLERLHGSFVTEKEVSELVAFLRDQREPDFDENLIKIPDDSDPQKQLDEEVDEMFDRAVAIVAETRNASISYVQRRLKIGYNRAARIVEQMELQGMIGPQEGTKPREVFLRNLDEDE